MGWVPISLQACISLKPLCWIYTDKFEVSRAAHLHHEMTLGSHGTGPQATVCWAGRPFEETTHSLRADFPSGGFQISCISYGSRSEMLVKDCCILIFWILFHIISYCFIVYPYCFMASARIVGEGLKPYIFILFHRISADAMASS